MITMLKEDPVIEILPASVEACHQMIRKLQNEIKKLQTQQAMIFQKLRGFSFVQEPSQEAKNMMESLRRRESVVAEREKWVKKHFAEFFSKVVPVGRLTHSGIWILARESSWDKASES